MWTASEAGSYIPVSANGTGCSSGCASISIDSTGHGEAIYEVLRANTSSSTEDFVVPVNISYTANPGQNIPALGTSTEVGEARPDQHCDGSIVQRSDSALC